jgi:lysophospholipase L1-like esterase
MLFSAAMIMMNSGAEGSYWIKLLPKVMLTLCALIVVSLFLARTFLDGKVTEEWTKAIFLSVGMFLLLLPIGEIVIRHFFRDITTTAHMSYFSKKWYAGVRTNSTGFREREFDPENGKRRYRIAVIGDSFTYGQGIDEKDRFTNLIEAELNKTRNGFEVLNFGVPGAETVDEIRILEKVIARAKPDFVLLQWFINDFEGGDKSRRPRPFPILPAETLNRKLMDTSALYVLASTQWGRIQERLNLSGKYESYMFRRFGDPESADSRTGMRELSDFIYLCEQHEIPLGIVLFPELVPNMDSAYPFDYLHDRIISIARQRNIEWLDLRETFAPYTKDGTECRKLYANRLDSHPSPFANRIAADSIVKKFGSIWVARDQPKIPRAHGRIR